MINKQLTMIYSDPEHPTNLNTEHFKTWKALHMFLFEKGLFPEFEVYEEGKPLLHYVSPYAERKFAGYSYKLFFDKSVPGSVLFEIVNKHASAKL